MTAASRRSSGLPSVAASDGGRLVVVYANPDGVWAVVRTAGDQAFGPPQKLGDAGGADPVVDMAPTGVAYAVWAQGGDIRAAYLPRRYGGFSGYPGALDAAPSQDAGTGAALRPAVSASADGLGVAVWGERDGAGGTHVIARRLVRGGPSAVYADATLPSLEGRPAGSADTPDVAIEDDSSYAWVAFRQTVYDGAGGSIVRSVARRLRGSAFDDATAVDGAPASGSVARPRVASTAAARASQRSRRPAARRWPA